MPLSSHTAPWTILSHLGADIGNGAWPLMQFLNPLDRLQLMAVNKEFRKAAIDYNQNLKNKMKKRGPFGYFKITFNLIWRKRSDYFTETIENNVNVYLNLPTDKNLYANYNRIVDAMMLSPKVYQELDKNQFVNRFNFAENTYNSYYLKDFKPEDKKNFINAIFDSDKSLDVENPDPDQKEYSGLVNKNINEYYLVNITIQEMADESESE